MPYHFFALFFSSFFLAKCDIERTDVNNISMGLWRDSGRLCLATLPVFALIRGEPHTQPDPSQCIWRLLAKVENVLGLYSKE